LAALVAVYSCLDLRNLAAFYFHVPLLRSNPRYAQTHNVMWLGDFGFRGELADRIDRWRRGWRRL